MIDPRIAPPLGLLYLAGWARAQGRDVSTWSVVDLNVACLGDWPADGHWTHDFSIERCLSLIPRGAYVYGFSLASMQLPHGRALARELRMREPGALLVAGGSHASALPDECCDPVAMRGGHFDVVVEREGEVAFLAVLAALDAGWTPRDGGGGSLPVLGARRASGGLGWVVRGTEIDPLDQLPFPARDLIDFSRYTRKIAGLPATNVTNSRGCPARCRWCQQESLHGSGATRYQSADRILAEVDDVYATTGIRHVLFLDDTLTARKRSEIYRLCDGLKERGVLWRGWTRANLCVRPGDREMLAYMGASGCQAICVGVESGSDAVLKAMDKGTTVAMNREAIRNVAEAGISARCSIMVGAARETWDDVFALESFLVGVREWLSDWILSIYVPLPGTPDWDRPGEVGLVIDKAKAREDGYRHFFVVGGDEQSGLVHSWADGTTQADIQARHDYVSEALLRLVPRDRVKVTQGRPNVIATS